MSKVKQLHSSYWLDIDQFNYDAELAKEANSDIIGLIQYRNVISNFVKILSGKSMPVTFASKGDSYTDNTKVVISANTDPQKFDVNVGLALHEASHVLLTDFNTLKFISKQYMWPGGNATPAQAAAIYGTVDTATIDELHTHMSMHGKLFEFDSSGYTPRADSMVLKSLLNIIEDRRIDRFVRDTAPGYIGYYDALYNEFFWNDTIGKMIRDKRYREPNISNYLAHICSITHPKHDPNALPGLAGIYKMIDLPNINRLKSTWDALILAVDIYGAIQKELGTKPDASFERDGDTNASGSDIGSGLQTDIAPDADSHATDSNDSDQSSDEPGNGEGILSESEEYSVSIQARIDKAAQRALETVNGIVKKSKLSRQDSDTVAQTDELCTIETVTDNSAAGSLKGIPVLFIKDMTPSKLYAPHKTKKNVLTLSPIGERLRGYFDRNWANREGTDYVVEELGAIIDNGFAHGAIVSKLLQTRTEERKLEYNRLKSGKIDPRRLAAALQDDSIFRRIRIDRYPDSYIHISIDASGSMGGERWNESLRFTAALAKACSLAGNIHLIIDVRIEIMKHPAVVIMYDSKRHKLNHFKLMFGRFEPSGSTPEALCFNAISGFIQKNARGKKSLFINFSDGAPAFKDARGKVHYSDVLAHRHTRSTVQGFKSSGIDVLSYFISNDGSTNWEFKEMYQESAYGIRPSDMRGLVNVINELEMESTVTEWH